MIVVFTDLDGTLLDADTYAWEMARPALQQLKSRGIPLVLATGKTRDESEFWRSLLRIGDPFIVENGGAAFIPKGYFPFPIPDAISRDGYQILEWGTPYDVLTNALETASRASCCRIVGSHQMDAATIGVGCGIPLVQAVPAGRREYDEPFRILEPARAGRLLAELEVRGLHLIQGGRFHHVCGANDKAVAVQAIAGCFRRLHEHVTTIGLGDAPNDAAFLESMDIPVVIRSKFSAGLISRIPCAVVTDDPGPLGWNNAILSLLNRYVGPR